MLRHCLDTASQAHLDLEGLFAEHTYMRSTLHDAALPLEATALQRLDEMRHFMNDALNELDELGR